MTWKKILLTIVLAGFLYAGCNTQSMLTEEEFFRDENPNLALTPTVCYWLADAAYFTFRYKLAIEIIDRNLKDFPYESGAATQEYRKAVCYEKLGDYRTAIGLFESYLIHHPKDNHYTTIEDRIGRLRMYGNAS